MSKVHIEQNGTRYACDVVGLESGSTAAKSSAALCTVDIDEKRVIIFVSLGLVAVVGEMGKKYLRRNELIGRRGALFANISLTFLKLAGMIFQAMAYDCELRTVATKMVFALACAVAFRTIEGLVDDCWVDWYRDPRIARENAKKEKKKKEDGETGSQTPDSDGQPGVRSRTTGSDHTGGGEVHERNMMRAEEGAASPSSQQSE